MTCNFKTFLYCFVFRSINPFGNEQSVMFFVQYNNPWHFFELIPFLFLGKKNINSFKDNFLNKKSCFSKSKVLFEDFV